MGRLERYKNRLVTTSQQELEDLHEQGYDFRVEQSPEGSSGYDTFIFHNNNETNQGYDTTQLKIIKRKLYSKRVPREYDDSGEKRYPTTQKIEESYFEPRRGNK